MRELAERNGAEPVVIVIDITKEEAHRRWQQNNRTKKRFAVHIDDFNMCADGFEFPDENETFLERISKPPQAN